MRHGHREPRIRGGRDVHPTSPVQLTPRQLDLLGVLKMRSVKTVRRILVALVLLGAVVIGTQMLGGGSASGSNSTGPESTDPFQSVTVPTGPKLAVSEIEVDAMSAASRAEEQQPTDTSVEEGTLEEAMKRIDPSTNFPTASPGLHRIMGQSAYLVARRGHSTPHAA